MSEPFVAVSGLTKQYGSFVALRDCHLAVQRGEVLGLLGPNGAGKSTLIRLLLGFLRPSAGMARIDGLDCYRSRVEVHRRLAYLPGDARLFRLMRARQVLDFFCQLRPDADRRRAAILAERLELDVTRWVGMMSTGMRQKLAIVVTLAIDAPLLILDEPTANLDPSVRGEVLQLVIEARDAGKTVLFSSHVLSEIEEVCDRVGILRAGELVHQQSLSAAESAHLVEAELTGPCPPLPAPLEGLADVETFGTRIRIQTGGDLQPLLGWLDALPARNLHIQRTGLRAIYDRFHAPPAARKREPAL